MLVHVSIKAEAEHGAANVNNKGVAGTCGGRQD